MFALKDALAKINKIMDESGLGGLIILHAPEAIDGLEDSGSVGLYELKVATPYSCIKVYENKAISIDTSQIPEGEDRERVIRKTGLMLAALCDMTKENLDVLQPLSDWLNSKTGAKYHQGKPPLGPSMN